MLQGFFSIGGLKNFFISTSSLEKSKEGRMYVWILKDALDCEKALPISVEVWTTHRTKHPTTKGVLIVERRSHDLVEQDTEHKVLVEVMKNIKCGIDDCDRYSEVWKYTPRSCESSLVTWLNKKKIIHVILHSQGRTHSSS